MLNIVDELTWEELAIRVALRRNSHDAINVLSELFTLRAVQAPLSPRKRGSRPDTDNC